MSYIAEMIGGFIGLILFLLIVCAIGVILTAFCVWFWEIMTAWFGLGSPSFDVRIVP